MARRRIESGSCPGCGHGAAVARSSFSAGSSGSSGLSAAPSSPRPDRGALVEALEPWGAAAEAGIEPGDVLLAWEREEKSPVRGPVLSPLEVNRIEREESPRGPISFRLWRNGREIEATLRRGEWGLTTSPVLSPSDRRATGNRLTARSRGRRATRRRRVGGSRREDARRRPVPGCALVSSADWASVRRSTRDRRGAARVRRGTRGPHRCAFAGVDSRSGRRRALRRRRVLRSGRSAGGSRLSAREERDRHAVARPRLESS